MACVCVQTDDCRGREHWQHVFIKLQRRSSGGGAPRRGQTRRGWPDSCCCAGPRWRGNPEKGRCSPVPTPPPTAAALCQASACTNGWTEGRLARCKRMCHPLLATNPGPATLHSMHLHATCICIIPCVMEWCNHCLHDCVLRSRV